MGQYGISIKFWSSIYQPSTNEFKSENSVVYLFQDRSVEDLIYISSIVKHLVGNKSLDNVINSNIPSINVKGEPSPAVMEPQVKVEQNYESGDEDHEDVNKFAFDMPEEKFEVACDKCGLKFSVRSELVSHLEECNPAQLEKLPPEIQPKTEEELLKRALLSKIEALSKLTKSTCQSCHKQFNNRNQFVTHLKICNPSQLQFLQPPEVKKQSKSKRKNEMSDFIDDEDEDEEDDYNPNAITCRFCPRQFTMKKCLAKHEYLHQTDPDNPKLFKENKKKRSSNGVSMPKGNYQCDKCSCSFRVHSALERHMEAHILSASVVNPVTHEEEISGLQTIELKDGKIMRCTKCDVAYNTYGMYRLHMQQYHEKSLNCDECGKKFTLPNTLKKHRLNYHTQFPKTCDDCGQFCATKDDFKSHLAKVHGEGIQENTVPCEICGKMVKNKYILKQHVKLVHEKKGGEFPCDQCGKVMKSKASLEYHSKVHTGEYAFRCDECGNGYMRFDQMLDCKNTHAGIFKFNCTHCDYKTNKTKAFKNHITIHSTEKPFICPLCNHPSNTTTNLNNHIKKVHKITLCQAEMIAKKNRFGQSMTEDDLETNRIKLERVEKVLDTMKLRPEYANINHQRPKEENMVQHGKRRPREPHPPPLVSQPRDIPSHDSLQGQSQDSSDLQNSNSQSNSYGARPLFFPYFGY